MRKISLSTFLQVTSTLLPCISERVRDDIGYLFDFLANESGERNLKHQASSDHNAKSDLTLKSLRHIMVDSFSLSSLSKEEFASFMSCHGVQVPNFSEAVNQDRCLSGSAIIDNITLGNTFKKLEGSKNIL